MTCKLGRLVCLMRFYLDFDTVTRDAGGLSVEHPNTKTLLWELAVSKSVSACGTACSKHPHPQVWTWGNGAPRSSRRVSSFGGYWKLLCEGTPHNSFMTSSTALAAILLLWS